jgi:hypothetical protein
MIHIDQNGTKSGCEVVRTKHMDVELPAYRQHLTHSVIRSERSKPVSLRCCGGRCVAKHIQWGAGMGGWRKRMPACNRLDKGSKFAPDESRAQFHLVPDGKKTVVRPFKEKRK